MNIISPSISRPPMHVKNVNCPYDWSGNIIFQQQSVLGILKAEMLLFS